MTDAYVTMDREGRLVLVDPTAAEVVHAVERENCRRLASDVFADRIRYFIDRAELRGIAPEDTLVVVINVDDRAGALLAEALMPGHDWSAIRARGETPYARGLAERGGIQEMLDEAEPAEGQRLRQIDGPAILMVDRGIATVFEPKEIGRAG